MAGIDGHEFPEALAYHPAEHLWLRAEAAGPDPRTRVTVGLDALGVEALGDVVYIQLVDPGMTVRRGEAMGSLEAEKMVRPVLAPVSGLVTEVNSALLQAPGLLSTDPYGRGWLVRLDAEAWEEERSGLITGPAIEAWVRAELAAHEGRE